MLHPFSYVAPRDKAELLRLLEREGSEIRLLAGGTDLLVELRLAKTPPNCLVDTKKLAELAGIHWNDAEGLSIGARVSCRELLASELVRDRFPLLIDAAGRLGSPQLRNRATVVGNLCTASPCADMGTALLALGAHVELESHRGVRRLPLREFFVGVKKTAIAPDELVTRAIVAPHVAFAKGGMEKLKRIQGHDLALASVAVARTATELRIAIGACAPTPVALPVLAADASVESVAKAAQEAISPIDDVRASADYRRFMVGVYVKRLLGRLTVHPSQAARKE